MQFDLYAFADYSGATTRALQHKALAWSVYDRLLAKDTVRLGWTRETLHQAVTILLQDATKRGARAIIGFDHCYSFPLGFYQAVQGTQLHSWREWLTWFHQDIERYAIEGQEINPRKWANAINELFITRDGFPYGPFWGPNFSPLKRNFTYEIPVPAMPQVMLHERRLVENRIKALKNIYQLGGAGSVGLQSLYGMYYIAKLLQTCEAQNIPLHVWPYDGWEIPANAHVLVEVYATLYLGKTGEKRSDATDALACTRWTTAHDEQGTLAPYFARERLSLSDEEEQRVKLEGWVLGI